MGRKVLNIANLKKTVHYLQKNGVLNTYYAARERIEETKQTDYNYEEPPAALLDFQRQDSKRFSSRFSIVVPAYETREEFLREMITSVTKQTYDKWELIIVDASTGNSVENIVKEYGEQEKRIRYLRLTENKGISENTNVGIEAADGDYIGLLDHDDTLTADALYEMASAIDRGRMKKEMPVLLFSNEDKYTSNGCYKDVNDKYKFNLDLILSNNYICHFMMAEAKLMKLLKLRGEYDGAQDYDFVLRLIANQLAFVPVRKLEDKITHVPKVLYHWRCHEESTAQNTASKTYAYEAGKAAIEDFCRGREWQVNVEHSLHLGFYRLEYVPDIFAVRAEAGIIGGRILDKRNRILSGIYNEKGERLYYNLHKRYSGGSTHRAALLQDCAAVDIRCMRIRKELQPVFQNITGVPYREFGEWKLADVSALSCDEEGYKKLSMELGRAAARMGYLVIWDPQITI